MLYLQGMGEGEGRKDVSDQIEDEDQLLGAQQKDQPPPDSKVHPTTIAVASGFDYLQRQASCSLLCHNIIYTGAPAVHVVPDAAGAQ